MTLIELSNIFNLVTQNIEGLTSYHFGFPDDLNQTILNNYNPSIDYLEVYPCVLCEPPSGDYDTKGCKVNRTITLLFVDLQQSNKDGAICSTLLETMSNLEGLGIAFLRTLKSLKINGQYLKLSLRNGSASTALNAYQFDDLLVTYSITISIASLMQSHCIDLSLDMVSDVDLEKLLCFKDEYSMYFNGVDQHLNLKGASALSFTNGGNDISFSFSVWIKPESTGTVQTIVSKQGLGSFDPTDEFIIRIDATGNIRVVLFSGLNTQNIVKVSDNAIVFGIWQLVAITYDASKTSNGLSIYRNKDKLTATGSDSGYLGIVESANDVLLGSRVNNAQPFKGSMDELKFYLKELTLVEVQEIHNEGIPKGDILSAPAYTYNKLGDGAIFDSGNWQLPDEKGVLSTAVSFGMDATNRTTDIPQ